MEETELVLLKAVFGFRSKVSAPLYTSGSGFTRKHIYTYICPHVQRLRGGQTELACKGLQAINNSVDIEEGLLDVDQALAEVSAYPHPPLQTRWHQSFFLKNYNAYDS